MSELMDAFEKACAAIWGQYWRAPMETACGLSRGATKHWRRREQIPPLPILGWVAWIVARPDRRSIGYLMLGLQNADTTSLEAAELAMEGLQT